MASHATAAYLWELLPTPPPRISITVARTGPGRKRPLPGVSIHRRDDLHRTDRAHRGPVPVTSVARTLCDLGQSVPTEVLDEAVDRALARRLVSARAMELGLRRLGGRGRTGPAQLRACLERRGVVGAPQPSVLESKVLRLLHRWGLTPLRCEHAVLAGTYRLDFLLVPGLALEVDGFTYHASPSAKAADTARRNRLVLSGLVVLQSDWLEVTRHPERLRATVLAGLDRVGATPTPRARPRRDGRRHPPPTPLLRPRPLPG
jgi:very-short-patch-repair endonuclease